MSSSENACVGAELDGIMIFPVSIMTKTDLDLHHIHWPDITFDDGQCCISNSSREK